MQKMFSFLLKLLIFTGTSSSLLTVVFLTKDVKGFSLMPIFGHFLSLHFFLFFN